MKDYYLYLDPDDGILYVLKDGEVIAPVKTSASLDHSAIRVRDGFLEVKDFISNKWESICDENGDPVYLLGSITAEDIEKLLSDVDKKFSSQYIEMDRSDFRLLDKSDHTASLVEKYSFKEGNWTITGVDLWIYKDGLFKKVLDIQSALDVYQRATSNALKTTKKTIEGAINELFDYMLSGTGVTYTASYATGDKTVHYVKISDQIGEYTTAGAISYSNAVEPFCTACIFVSDQSPVIPSNPNVSVYSLGDNFTIEEGQTAYLVFADKNYLSDWVTSGKDLHDECSGDLKVTVSNFACKQVISTFGLRSEPVFIEVPLESQVFIPQGSIQNKTVILVKPIFSSDYISIDDVSAELIDQLHKEILQHPDKKLTIGGFYIEINCTDNTISPNLPSLTAVYNQSELLLAYLSENSQAHLSVSDMLYVTTEGAWVAV